MLKEEGTRRKSKKSKTPITRKKKEKEDVSEENFPDYYKEFASLKLKSPFSDEINQTRIPRRLKRPVVGRYDGTTDPNDHVSNFTRAIRAIPMNQNLRCIFFGGTLDGSTRY